MKILITTILLTALSASPASAMCNASDTKHFWTCFTEERDRQEALELERQQLQELEAIRREVEGDHLIKPAPPVDDDGD